MNGRICLELILKVWWWGESVCNEIMNDLSGFCCSSCKDPLLHLLFV
jgi:hypothetical protein